MAILDKVHCVVGRKSANSPQAPLVDDPIALLVRAHDREDANGPVDEGASREEDKPADNAQTGVKKIEAVTLAWSKKSVYIYWCCMLLSLLQQPDSQPTMLSIHSIWLVTLVNNMRSSVVMNLTPYAMSSFQGHSLLTVITVITSSMAGAVYIPMAKALDLCCHSVFLRSGPHPLSCVS